MAISIVAPYRRLSKGRISVQILWNGGPVTFGSERLRVTARARTPLRSKQFLFMLLDLLASAGHRTISLAHNFASFSSVWHCKLSATTHIAHRIRLPQISNTLPIFASLRSARKRQKCLGRHDGEVNHLRNQTRHTTDIPAPVKSAVDLGSSWCGAIFYRRNAYCYYHF